MDHIHTFLTTQGHGGPPRWVISPMPGPPPRQHKHERQYTPSTHCHPNNADMEWWLWRPNDIRGPWGPKVSWYLSYRWGKNPEKTSPRKPVPTGDRARTRCVTSAHATTCSTAVDVVVHNYHNIKKENYIWVLKRILSATCSPTLVHGRCSTWRPFMTLVIGSVHNVTSVHGNASLCPSATNVPIQYLFPRCSPYLSRRKTHNQMSSATMDKCTYLRKYAFRTHVY